MLFYAKLIFLGVCGSDSFDHSGDILHRINGVIKMLQENMWNELVRACV